MDAAAVAAPTTQERSSSSGPQKLPIYPKDEPVIALEPNPTRLELEIRRARLAATEQYLRARGVVRESVESWIGLEARVESRLKSLKARDEALTPGALYVGVATLTGSVLSRGRALPVRALLPPAFLFASLPYFLPRTAANVGAYARELERAHFPALAEQHDAVVAQTSAAWKKTSETVHVAAGKTQDGVRWAVSETQRLTGLRLREALGWAEKKAPEVESQLKHAIDAAKKEGKELVETTKKEIEEVRKAK